MAAKLTLEWGDGNDLILRKKKGKITFQEVLMFMHEREQLFNFDGDLMVFQFRVSDQHDVKNGFSPSMAQPADGNWMNRERRI